MIQTPHRILLFSLVASFLLIGCGGSSGTKSNTAPGRPQDVSMVKDDIEDLRGFVNLPEEADEVAWVEDEIKPADAERLGAKDAKRRLVAVLRFEGEAAQRFSATINGLGKGEPVTLGVESWFPAELIAKGQIGAEETLRGTSYPATPFVKDSYNSGRIVKIEGADLYILEMYAR